MNHKHLFVGIVLVVLGVGLFFSARVAVRELRDLEPSGDTLSKSPFAVTFYEINRTVLPASLEEHGQAHLFCLLVVFALSLATALSGIVLILRTILSRRRGSSN